MAIPLRRTTLKSAHTTWFTTLFLFLCLATQTTQTHAAETAENYPDIRELHFSSVEFENADPSGEVGRITQDHLGFIWFSTREGAHRYDGYQVRTYSNDPDDSSSLFDNFVVSFFVDHRDQFWIGSDKGVSRYIQETDTFKNYYFDGATPGSNQTSRSNAFVEDSQNTLYVTAESGFVYRYDPNNDSFDRVNDSSLGIIKSMVVDNDDMLWIGSRGELYSLNPKTGASKRYQEGLQPVDGSANNFIESMSYESPNRLWLGTASYGTIIFNTTTGEMQRLPRVYSNESYVHEIKKDKLGNMWVAHSDGITIHIADSGEIIRYNRNDRQSPLPSSGVMALHLDIQGNVWVGSASHGLYSSKRNKRFEQIPDYVVGNANRDQTVVSRLIFDSNENLWIGRNATGIDIYKSDGSRRIKLRHNPKKPRSLSPNTVFAITEDSKGNVWVGTFRGGLQKYNEKTLDFDTYKHQRDEPNSLAGNDVRSIIEDNQGNLWINTHGRGISRFDPTRETFKNFRHDPNDTENSLIDDWGFSLDLLPDGRIILGTSGGITVMDTETFEIQNFDVNANKPNSLPNDVINEIFIDSKKRVWLGTNDGLSLFNLEEGTFENYSLKDGFPNRVVASILEDDNGSLWIGTFDGLVQFDPETGDVKTYHKGDGLGDNEFYPRAAAKDSTGKLYFGQKNGVSFFYPPSIEENKYIPDIRIVDFKVFNESLEINPTSKEAGFLKKNILDTETIVLNPDQKVITIEFVALNYIQSNKNNYAYKLEGFDKQWNETGTRRVATYTNLNPGHYVFKVKASNNDGYWNETPRELSIIVLPPFWQTIWFKLLAAFIFIAGPVVIVYWRLERTKAQKVLLESKVQKRTRDLADTHEQLAEAFSQLEQGQVQIQKQNKELISHHENLEQQVKNRTKELEDAKEKAEHSDLLKSAFLANMSHEIRTPMNAIMGLLEILRFEDINEEERERYNDVIKQSSQTLLTLIDDILDLSSIEAGEAILNNTPCSIDGICEELFALYQPTVQVDKQDDVSLVLSREGITGITMPHEKECPILEFDEVRLKQILTNLLSNSIKFTDQGEIRFGYETIDDGTNSIIQFFVSDTGIGIPKDQLDLIFDRFHKVEKDNDRFYRGTGLGLTITRKFVELMGGAITVKSEEGKGTNFVVEFPIQKNSRQQISSTTETQLEITSSNFKSQTGSLGAISILVAEDEEPNYIFIKKALEIEGIHTTWVADGAEAIKAYDSYTFDLVLLDMKMPRIGGGEVLKHIRSMDSQTPIIVQTAFAMEADREAAILNGVNAFLAKPFTARQLLDSIASCLSKQIEV